MATTHDHTHGPVSGPDAPEAGDYKRIQMHVLGKDRDKEYTIKK